MKCLLFLLVLCSYSHAEDFEVIDQLHKLSPKQIPQRQDKRFKSPQQKYFEPITFRAILKKGSIITRSSDNKNFIVPQDIYVKATQDQMDESIAQLEGDPLFITSMLNLSSLEEDFDLSPSPKSYQSYKPVVNIYSMDKELTIINEFNIHQEFLQMNYLQEIFSQNSASASATRYELKNFVKWKLPIEVGLVTSFQSGAWEPGGQYDQQWKAIYLGPGIAYQFWSTRWFDLKVGGSFQSSLYFNAQTKSSELNYSSNGYQLDLQSRINTSLGKFLLGLTYRRMEIDVGPVDNNIALDSSRNNITSIGIHLGYQFDLLL